MKNLIYILLLWFAYSSCQTKATLVSSTDIQNSKDLITAMHARYKGKWFDQFTFVQKTVKYDKSEQPLDTTIWYEAIDYPKKFRIDFGPIKEGNAVLFDQDSMWIFKQNQFVRSAFAPREFLLMKGGLYHLSIEETLTQLENYGYDTEKFYTTNHNDRKVYVLGAKEGDLTSKQFWLDATHFYMVRRISPSNEKTLDVLYSKHIQRDGGWVEQIVDFWVDGKFVQKEWYQDINTNPKLKASLFNWQQFGETHWYKE